MKSKIIIYALSVGFLFGCQTATKENKSSKTDEKPIPVIFETDMGNDVDDALALDMLYKYADQGKIKLLGISTNKDNKYSIPFLDILNTWYGYPDIPLGSVVNGTNSEGDSRNYAQAVCEYRVGGKSPFHGSVKDYSSVEESTRLYRKILSQQADSSVVLISVGFLTNLARLLATQPDEYSKLDGKDLIAKKVKLLSVMGGSFEGDKIKEYNIVKDKEASRKVFKEWPTQIVVSPFEVGNKILYPAKSIQQDFKWAPDHPVVIAYESYLKMPYDRPTWDLTATLYAVEGNKNNYFQLSQKGTISVDSSGSTDFKMNKNGKHAYLEVDSMQIKKIKSRFINLVSAPPAHAHAKPHT